MQNSRKYPRIPVVMLAHMTPRGGQKACEVLVRDICTHGMGIYGHEPYEKGDFIVVDISFVTINGDIEESVLAEVVWVNRIEADEAEQYAVGLKFEQLEKEKSKLYDHLKFLEGKRLDESEAFA
ncbi:PilZ domain-containing protein [Nitrospira defluvii]|nr:PilZ domain-containing protein [Nitrospira defluvii]